MNESDNFMVNFVASTHRVLEKATSKIEELEGRIAALEGKSGSGYGMVDIVPWDEGFTNDPQIEAGVVKSSPIV